MGKRLRMKDMKTGYDLGFLDGKDAGYQKGYDEGFSAAMQVAIQIAREEIPTLEDNNEA